MNLRPELSILIPVRNEGMNLKFMLKILEATVDMSHETIVVYDSLDDDSVPVVKDMQTRYPQILSIHNKLGRGVLNAVRAGINAASSGYILIIAADDIGPVLAIDEMKELMDRGCDLVSATRYARGGRVLGGSFIGSRLSRLANNLSYWILGVAFTDSTVGIKMFRRSLFDEINLEAKPIGFAFSYELSLKAQRARMKLGEVPIISINRFYGGKSSFKIYSWVKEYSKWFLWGLKHSGELAKNKKLMLNTVREPTA
jgi:dolichol-phosphate mannosyltransferase